VAVSCFSSQYRLVLDLYMSNGMQWHDALAKWVGDRCEGDIDTRFPLVVKGSSDVPSSDLINLMSAAACTTGQVVSILSAKRKRECDSDSDYEPDTKRIKLVTPDHGSGCICGQLTCVRSIKMAGKVDLNALVCNDASKETAHVSLSPELLLDSRSAMMIASISDTYNACVHVWCPTKCIESVVLGKTYSKLTNLPLFGPRCEKVPFNHHMIKDNMYICDGLVFGRIINKHKTTGRSVLSIVCAPQKFGIRQFDECLVKIDSATIRDCYYEVSILYTLQTMTSCIVRLHNCFSVKRHPKIGTFTATFMEKLTPLTSMMRQPSVKVSLLLVRALGSGIAVQECMREMNLLNMDIRVANMGATMSRECLESTLGPLCCPCPRHGARGLDVRIFDVGLVVASGEYVKAETMRWVNKNMASIVSYIKASLTGAEYSSVVDKLVELQKAVHISSDYRLGGIIVCDRTKNTWQVLFNTKLKQNIGWCWHLHNFVKC
jgi:hypothetical protein